MPTPVHPALYVSGRELSEPRPSPDGRWVLVGVRAGGRSGLVLVPMDGGPERALAVDPQPALGSGLGGGCTSWLPDGSGFAYAGRDGQVWVHRLDGQRRCLTHLPADASVTAPAVSPDGRSVAYAVDLAEIRVTGIDDDRDEAVSAGWDFVSDPAWRPDGTGLVWTAWSVPHMPWDEAVVLGTDVTENMGGEPHVVAAAPGHQLQQPRYDGDGTLWSVRDTTGWLNVWRGEQAAATEPFEHAGPSWGAGQRSYAVSADGCRFVHHRNEGGFGRLVVVDRADGSRQEIGKGVHGQLSWAGDRIVALRTGARTPTQVVVYEPGPGGWDRRVLLVGPAAEWDHLDLVEPELFEATAPDGTPVPARCYRPAAGVVPAGLIVWSHGGPTDQWPVTFLPRLVYWLSRGFTVVLPDYRGSTGHGRAYQQALNGRWGEADTADVAATIAHAHAAGWGRPATTVLMGGSAGGFVALNVLIAHPELVAGAAVLYPVTDLVTLRDGTHRFEAHYDAILAGPLATDEDHARYRAWSPLHQADRIRRPLLVLHGDLDENVPVQQSIDLVARARAAGADAELHVYEGERHGFRQPDTLADELARITAFVTRLVGA